MARFGRRFPTPSPLVAANEQVPIVANIVATLPTPLVMAATAGPGITADMALLLPTPMQMLGSGAVGVGAIVGDILANLPTPMQISAVAQVSTTVPIPTGLWSSADLLARCKFYAQRPAVDEAMSDAQWFSLMTEGQAHWTRVIGTMTPEVLYGPPVLMQTADGGLTYTFGTDADGNAINPIGHAEIKLTPFAPPWFAGADFDPSGNFIWEGDRIRFFGQAARPYTNGPWARFVKPSGTLDGSGQNEPSIKPPHVRILVVNRAVILWAQRGGYRNPAPFMAMEKANWLGDPASGDTGILGALKTAYYTRGSEAILGAGANGRWWAGINTGQGYAPIPP